MLIGFGLPTGGLSGVGGASQDDEARASAQAANDAIDVINADNATQTELDDAVAALQVVIGDRVEQSVFDALVAGNATDAELDAVQAAIDAVNAAQDAAIAALQTDLDGKVDQTVFDALVAGNATDAELAAVQAALDAVNAAQDAEIAAQELVDVDHTGRIEALENGSLYQGIIPAGDYDFTSFPAPITGNAYIDSAPTDIPAGTKFIAGGDGSFTLDPSANPFLVYEFTEGDTITVIEDAATWPVAVLNVNADTGTGPSSDIFTKMNLWDLDNGALPVREGLFGSTPTAILEDNTSNTAHYALAAQLPHTTAQTVCLRIKRDINPNNTFYPKARIIPECTFSGRTSNIIAKLSWFKCNLENRTAINPVNTEKLFRQ